MFSIFVLLFSFLVFVVFFSYLETFTELYLFLARLATHVTAPMIFTMASFDDGARRRHVASTAAHGVAVSQRLVVSSIVASARTTTSSQTAKTGFWCAVIW